MTKRRITIDVDSEALSALADLYQTSTDQETVYFALRNALQLSALRREAGSKLREMARNGDFDLLMDKRNYRPHLPPLTPQEEDEV